MENVTNMTGKTLYPVHCTICGELIKNKTFPLDRVLEQYHNGREKLDDVREIIKMLGIRAEFGGAVLPKFPALYQKGEFVIPSQSELEKRREEALNSFQCQDNQVPEEQLRPVSINMSSLVGQFYLATGFYDIYRMLHLLSDNGGDLLNSFESDRQSVLDLLCDSFIALPNVHLSGEMTYAEDRRDEVKNILSQILLYAKVEGEMQDGGEDNTALEQISAGWRYKVVNGREMPFALVARGGSGKFFDIEDCRCPHCGSRISHKMGAYRQKIVGILGTQATGKTTFLAALTDAIQTGEVTSQTESNGNVKLTGLTIQPCADNDPQWERVVRRPKAAQSSEAPVDLLAEPDALAGETDNAPGMLLLYQNGFPPEKTRTDTMDASAITFLVSPSEDKNQEPVMYTLADIPGESFFDYEKKEEEEMLVKIQHKILFASSAIVMVISSRQLLNLENQIEVSDKLVKSPSDILAAYEKFLPDHPVPTAVVLTACDELSDGDLRKEMHLAFDIRKCPPLVWSERQDCLVYNAEPMHTAIGAVWDFLNSKFGLFAENLANILKRNSQEAMELGAFAVSNGTQYAPRNYAEVLTSGEEDTEAARTQRYQDMRKGRFGVSAPLLWLLARDGLLNVGCGEPENSDDRPQVQSLTQRILKNSLKQG